MSGSVSVSGDLASGEAAGPHRFERVLKQLPQAVVVVDSELVIEYANPAAASLLGDDQRGGRPLRDPGPDLPLRELATKLFGPDPPAAGRFARTDDRVFWVEGVPPSEQEENAILIVEDMTERERARRSEREFVENAAHELRTPLAAIISIMDVLESGAKDVPEARDRFLKHLRVHTERLSRLARSLLVLARLQAGVEQARLTAVPVRPVLEEVAQGLHPFLGVEISVHAPSDVGAIADTELLHRVIANVAENAAKHTRAGQIVLEARQREETTEIEIRDTGPGMTESAQARAFQRFYRSDGRGMDGFGLGLAIAREAANALSATIELDSEPGAGTRVRVALPNAKILT
jgi:two-component system, OmpR family, phosphate regulon sensor histidine kinase PhoR